MTPPATGYETPIDLDRDAFMRRLIASLGHLNEGVLGSDVAGAYIMNVGLSMGAAIEDEYKRFWGIDRPFTVDEYAHVIVDLKQKIKGNFSLVSKDADKVVVRTSSCPFDEFVRTSPSLCFMTSSVFGGIAARNFGWAKVALHRRIALGDDGCFVSVFLRRTPEAESAVGKEYAPTIEQANPDIRQQLRLMERVRDLHEDLDAATSQWEEMIRGVGEAIARVDLDGTVLFANARWRDLLGVEGEELRGDGLTHLFDEAGQDLFDLALAQLRNGRRVDEFDSRMRSRDGKWRQVVVSGGPIKDRGGSVSSGLFLFRDVTGERQAQRLKDQFLLSASHEMRTPLATIKMLAQMIERSRGDGADGDDELQKRLATIVHEVDRLTKLGSELLDASRLEPGSMALRGERYDLRSLVAAAVERARVLVSGTGRWEITLDQPTDPVEVIADAARIDQVLTNLLTNAIKYSPDGGAIAVGIDFGDGAAHVSVADSGMGVPAEDREQLFTPFHRGSNAAAADFAGMGIGLYLSRSIARLHGGDLRHAPGMPVGSIFTLDLPLATH